MPEFPLSRRFLVTLRTPPPARRRAAALAGTLATLLVVAPVPVHAETPSRTPAPPAGSPSLTPSATPTPAVTPSGQPTPTATPDPAGTLRPKAGRNEVAKAAARALTLEVKPGGSTVTGGFYQDVGRFAFSGTATGLADGTGLEVYRRLGNATTWSRVARATVTQGTYQAALPVTGIGAVTFASTTGGAPGSGDEVSSPMVQVSVRDARLLLDRPANTDSLKNPRLTGSVIPARGGVKVSLELRTGSSYRVTAKATTDAAGRFRVTFGYGKGHLASYPVRAAYQAANRPRTERSGVRTVRRVAVLNAVVTATSAADVAKTYRKGCPVGRSRLSTVKMNFYGRDKLMHRGVLVIRTDLVPEIKRGFTQALVARFPIAKMDNPNVYGGDDPTQMAANNTSGFNCRKVVGNPFAQSPHSYGIAIDVDTVQNPYRDSRGKWWPPNGKPYIDRTPLRFGMLGTKSALTRQLRSDDFFWGGLWNPGRDYQHFEYRP
jgi:hypothetical protein